MCGQCDDSTIVMATDLIKEVLDDGKSFWTFAFHLHTLLRFSDSDATLHVETAQLIYHILDYIRSHGIPSEVATKLRPWFERIAQFSSTNKEIFDGMDEVVRLVDRFAVALNSLLD